MPTDRSIRKSAAGLNNAQHDIMTIDDLVAYLRIPKSTLYKLAQEGRIPGQKVGRHWRFHKDMIDTWIKSDLGNTERH